MQLLTHSDNSNTGSRPERAQSRRQVPAGPPHSRPPQAMFFEHFVFNCYCLSYFFIMLVYFMCRCFCLLFRHSCLTPIKCLCFFLFEQIATLRCGAQRVRPRAHVKSSRAAARGNRDEPSYMDRLRPCGYLPGRKNPRE